MKHYNIPIFIVHYGCPNMCVFCNQEKITGREANLKPQDIKNIIDENLSWLPNESVKEVAFFGGTFTALPIELQKEYLKEVKSYIDSNLVNGIRLSTRPDCINEEILELLKEYNVTVIELGVQSLDDKVLELSERGYTEEAVFRAAELIKKSNIKLGIQIMPGLPGSNDESDLLTVQKVVKIKPDFARIYPTLVINNTKLEKMYLSGEYVETELNKSVNFNMKILALLELNDIKIIRIGLQPSDDLRAEGVIKAGPFHPAYRELIETEIYYNFFVKLLYTSEYLDIKSNEKNISKIVGLKKKNKIRLKNRINVGINKDLSIDEILINNQKFSRKEILRAVLGA